MTADADTIKIIIKWHSQYNVHVLSMLITKKCRISSLMIGSGIILHFKCAFHVLSMMTFHDPSELGAMNTSRECGACGI